MAYKFCLALASNVVAK